MSLSKCHTKFPDRIGREKYIKLSCCISVACMGKGEINAQYCPNMLFNLGDNRKEKWRCEVSCHGGLGISVSNLYRQGVEKFRVVAFFNTVSHKIGAGLRLALAASSRNPKRFIRSYRFSLLESRRCI